MKGSKSKLLQWLLAGAGVLSVALGVAGIFLPLLPTTPFLLLAATCFLHSSKRLHRWLLHHKWFGPYIRNYQKYKALPASAKFWTLSLLWGTMLYAIFFVLDALVLQVLLLLIAISVTVHILKLKTLTVKMRLDMEEIPPPSKNTTYPTSARTKTDRSFSYSSSKERSSRKEKICPET
jgi:uncharacterized membrane protein YbaN (DUF454 family)